LIRDLRIFLVPYRQCLVLCAQDTVVLSSAIPLKSRVHTAHPTQMALTRHWVSALCTKLVHKSALCFVHKTCAQQCHSTEKSCAHGTFHSIVLTRPLDPQLICSLLNLPPFHATRALLSAHDQLVHRSLVGGLAGAVRWCSAFECPVHHRAKS